MNETKEEKRREIVEERYGVTFHWIELHEARFHKLGLYWLGYTVEDDVRYVAGYNLMTGGDLVEYKNETYLLKQGYAPSFFELEHPVTKERITVNVKDLTHLQTDLSDEEVDELTDLFDGFDE